MNTVRYVYVSQMINVPLRASAVFKKTEHRLKATTSKQAPSQTEKKCLE